jgi:hypothetical protein
MSAKTIVEIDAAKFQAIEKALQKVDEIHAALALKSRAGIEDHLTVEEFLQVAKISQATFDKLRPQIKTISPTGRKLLIPMSEVKRYFAGEFAKKDTP